MVVVAGGQYREHRAGDIAFGSGLIPAEAIECGGDMCLQVCYQRSVGVPVVVES